MKDLEPVYLRLIELKHDCQVKNAHQATIDLVEDAYYGIVDSIDDCDIGLESKIRLIHYDILNILEIVDKSLPDYNILCDLEQEKNIIKIVDPDYLLSDIVDELIYRYSHLNK